jgi:hypothetical protein
MINEKQIEDAADIITKKSVDLPTLMSNMQNSSSVDYHNADLRKWLAGMNDYGYNYLMERLEGM